MVTLPNTKLLSTASPLGSPLPYKIITVLEKESNYPCKSQLSTDSLEARHRSRVVAMSHNSHD